MKRCVFFVLCLILSVHVSKAADSTANWSAWKKTWVQEKLDMEGVASQSDSNLIRTIEVMDMRSDTVNWGMYTSKSQRPHSLVSDVSIRKLINGKLANNPSGKSLLFVVRSFWINESNTEVKYNATSYPMLNGGVGGTNASSYNVSTSKMKCAVDVFILMGESYYALVRIDTLLRHKKKVNNAAERLIDDAFELMNRKIAAAIYANRYQNKKPATKDVIFENYNKVYNTPFFTSGTVKKGVYYSWEQLKTNQPDNVEFNIQENEKEPPTLYLKDEQGKFFLTRNVYALSDGDHVYKVQKGYVFEMIKDHRSVYWLGIERLDIKAKGVPVLFFGAGVMGYGSEAVGSRLKVKLTPILLNIETGEEY